MLKLKWARAKNNKATDPLFSPNDFRQLARGGLIKEKILL